MAYAIQYIQYITCSPFSASLLCSRAVVLHKLAAAPSDKSSTPWPDEVYVDNLHPIYKLVLMEKRGKCALCPLFRVTYYFLNKDLDGFIYV